MGVCCLFLLGLVFVVHRSPRPEVSRGSALDIQLQVLEQAIARNRQDTTSALALTELYLQKVRETADVAYYEKIDQLIGALATTTPEVLAARASVALGRHHFREGYALTTQALAGDPNNYRYYGLKGDAEIELGKYEEAVASFQEMVNRRPNFSSHTRIAYIRELYGDVPGAEQALAAALTNGSSYPENLAWAAVELGKLAHRHDPAKAKEWYLHALAFVPEYPPALEGLGKHAYFRGAVPQAVDFVRRAYQALPIAQYAITLGDISMATGSTTLAAQQYTLAELAYEQSAKSGVTTDLEYAVFLLDRDRTLPIALERARAAYAERPGIYAADALAWALYKNRQYAEARTYSTEALRLSETEAPLLYHRGLIALALGKKGEAKAYLEKALAADPYFSILHATAARATLQSL